MISEEEKEKDTSTATYSNGKPSVLTADLFKINLNSCNSDDLIQLKGIGPTYAKMILEFREKLGGFYSVNQLYDIPYIKPEAIANNLNYFEVDNTFANKIYWFGQSWGYNNGKLCVIVSATDLQGNLLWTKYFGTNNNNLRTFSVSKTKDSNFMIACSDESNSLNKNMFVLKNKLRNKKTFTNLEFSKGFLRFII